MMTAKYGVRWQSEAATPLWDESLLSNAKILLKAKAAWRFASRRTP